LRWEEVVEEVVVEEESLLPCCALIRLRRTRGGRASKPPTRSRRTLRSPAFDDPAFSLGYVADIENTASSIRVKLTTIQYGDPAHRDIAGLRQLLQNYVNLVMAFAKDVGR
jgi:hypothetical protein